MWPHHRLDAEADAYLGITRIYSERLSFRFFQFTVGYAVRTFFVDF